MVFFNSSLRTRLSTQKAGMNLGMNTIVLDVNQGAMEIGNGTRRNNGMATKPEHLLEAILLWAAIAILLACGRLRDLKVKNLIMKKL